MKEFFSDFNSKQRKDFLNRHGGKVTSILNKYKKEIGIDSLLKKANNRDFINEIVDQVIEDIKNWANKECYPEYQQFLTCLLETRLDEIKDYIKYKIAYFFVYKVKTPPEKLPQICDSYLDDLYYGLNDKFKYGKYKGKTIKKILKDDWEYLDFAAQKFDDFELTQEAKKKLKEKIADDKSTCSKKLELNDQLDFGKYEGKKVETVLNKDPKYLDWALKNVKEFDLTQEVKDDLKNKEASNKKIGLNDKIPFGKYKGEKITDILRLDKEYIEHFKNRFDKEAKNLLSQFYSKTFNNFATLSVQTVIDLPLDFEKTYHYKLCFSGGSFKITGESVNNKKVGFNNKWYNYLGSLGVNLYDLDENKLFIKSLIVGRKILSKQWEEGGKESLDIKTTKLNPYQISFNLKNTAVKFPTVSAGTTCSKSTSGNSGKTYFEISNLGANTSRFYKIKGKTAAYECNLDSVRFELAGHSEFEVFLKALEFIIDKNRFLIND